MGEQTTKFYARNSFQATPDGMSLFDTMPSADPVIFVTGGEPISSIVYIPSEGWQADRAFGTHLKEAVAIVKDWVKNR
ncbi:MAG: hypothetical protein EPN47_00110 [Acidobacteria bacterium]|nr:MAG: hypothetical protein EPN47_00110 [Acidobacteriota bacterium]